MPARKPNKRSSIYLGSDGWWHGWVTIGSRDDGSPDRRHRKARTEAARLTQAIRRLAAIVSSIWVTPSSNALRR